MYTPPLLLHDLGGEGTVLDQFHQGREGELYIFIPPREYYRLLYCPLSHLLQQNVVRYYTRWWRRCRERWRFPRTDRYSHRTSRKSQGNFRQTDHHLSSRGQLDERSMLKCSGERLRIYTARLWNMKSSNTGGTLIKKVDTINSRGIANISRKVITILRCYVHVRHTYKM